MCRLFAFEELKEATNGFDSARFLGEGSMGKVTPKTKIFIRDLDNSLDSWRMMIFLDKTNTILPWHHQFSG